MLLLFPSTSVKQQDYIQVWLSSSWGFSAAGHLTQEVGKKILLCKFFRLSKLYLTGKHIKDNCNSQARLYKEEIFW